MEILKIAVDWVKSEVFSSRFFILFAIGLLIASIGFWQLGKTEIARTYVIPTLVAGVLLLAVGIGIFYANKSRITSFERHIMKIQPSSYNQKYCKLRNQLENLKP